MTVEKHVAGALLLVSDEAIKLYELLTAEGTTMEFLSGMFEASARGMMQAELLGISGKLDAIPSLESKVDRLIQLVEGNGLIGGAGGLSAPLSTSESTGENPGVEVELQRESLVPKKQALDTSAMSGMMTRMQGMRTNK
jgi:hypothetical protein